MNAPSDVTFVLHHEKQNVFIHVQVKSIKSDVISVWNMMKIFLSLSQKLR